MADDPTKCEYEPVGLGLVPIDAAKLVQTFAGS
jgi:hypothetical protein